MKTTFQKLARKFSLVCVCIIGLVFVTMLSLFINAHLTNAYATFTNSASTIRWDDISSRAQYGPHDKFHQEAETKINTLLTGVTGLEVFDANDTLTAAESGKVCVSIGFTGAVDSNNLILTLPTAAAAVNFWFYDANVTATDDLWITAGAGDTINGGTAVKSYKCTGDALKQGIWVVAQDATSWIVMSEVGTWSNYNN